MSLVAPPALPLFQRWLSAGHGRMALVARTLGVSAPAVWSWKKGISRPSEHFREPLEKLTDGAVPANHWQLAEELALRVSALERVSAEQAKPTGTEDGR